MLLRFLLNLVKPSNEQLRCKKVGMLLGLKIWSYQLLLRRLLKTYLHYAISDTIIIDNGTIKIVHELRDLEFESELVRNKINFKADVISRSIPLSTQKGKSTCNFHFFKFKSKLSLYVGGKELFIKHDDTCLIDGTLTGKIKCTSKNSYIFQSIIEILCTQNSIDQSDNTERHKQSANNDSDSGQRRRKKTSSQNVFGREKEISSITTQKESRAGIKESIYDNQPNVIEKKGFDIDASF